MKLAIILPAFDPDLNIIDTVKALASIPDSSAVVVNDGSNDEYDELFGKLHNQCFCHVIRLDPHQGKGGAIKAGMRYAIRVYPGLRWILASDMEGRRAARDLLTAASSLPDLQDSIVLKRDSCCGIPSGLFDHILSVPQQNDDFLWSLLAEAAYGSRKGY